MAVPCPHRVCSHVCGSDSRPCQAQGASTKSPPVDRSNGHLHSMDLGTWGPCMEALSGGGLSPLAFLQSGSEHTHTTECGNVMARMQAGRLLPEHESGGTRRLAGTQACCARPARREAAHPPSLSCSLLSPPSLRCRWYRYIHTYVHKYTYKYLACLLSYVCTGNYIYI